TTTGTIDRGTKHADFAVLRKVPCAAVLVEMGFLSNSGEAEKLSNVAYQRRLAIGIARGIRRFHQAVAE
ncbi:MAG: N-acetylmuramoyl-L-alanine amidase, partial [Lentisphaeria bacterium]